MPNSTLGPVQIFSLDLCSINLALMEIQNRLDEGKGLRGEAIVNDRVRLHNTPVQDLNVEPDIVTNVYAETPRGVPPLQQVEALLATGLVGLQPLVAPPAVGNTSLIGSDLTRYASEGHTHEGVNLADAQTIVGTKTLGAATVGTGKLNFAGVTSGVVTVQAADIAGTWSLTLPTSGGTAGYILSTDGTGITTWLNPAALSGIVASLASSDSSLTIAPPFGAVDAIINTAHTNIWSVLQTISLNTAVPVLSTDTDFPPPHGTTLHLVGEAAANNYIAWHTFAGSPAFLSISSGAYDGTFHTVGQTPANWPMFSLIAQGHDTVDYTSNAAAIRLKSINAFTTTDHGTLITFLTTAAGTTTFGQVAQIAQGLAVGTTTDPGAGVVNVLTGYRIGNAAASGQYLRGNGTNFVSNTIQAGDLPGAFSGFANPSASIGLSTVNGSATTAMRSDGAPALSQAIAPTWTGKHYWTPSANATDVLRVRQSAGDPVLDVDTTNRRVGIMTETPLAPLHIHSTNNGGAAVPLIRLRTDGASANNGPAIDFYIADNAPAEVLAGRIAMSLTDGTAGSLDADWVFSHAVNGSAINNTVKWGNTSGTITFPNTAADTVAMLAVANHFTALQTIDLGSRGTTPPSGTVLHLMAPDSTASFFVFNSYSAASGIVNTRSRLTAGVEGAVVAGNRLGAFIGRGHDGTSISTDDSGYFGVFPLSTWTNSNHETYLALFTTANGATGSGVERVRVALGLMCGTTTDSGAGTIRANAGFYTEQATFMLHSTAAWNNGAGALTGTLTNSPATGNPTKWLAVDDNGTTRYIPAW